MPDSCAFRAAVLLLIVLLAISQGAIGDSLTRGEGAPAPQYIVPSVGRAVAQQSPSPVKSGAPTPDATGDPDYSPPNPQPSVSLDKLPNARPLVAKRRFRSRIVDAEVKRVAARISDAALKRIWTNTYPNTLDTTVGWVDLDLGVKDHALAFPRSFLITGDIEASWLRDSTSQIFPYLDLLKSPGPGFQVGDTDWVKLYRLALGLVYQQSQFVITHPLANSFGAPKSATIKHPTSYAVYSDWFTPPQPGSDGHYYPQPGNEQKTVKGNDGVYLWEVKWEVDSLANFLRLPVALHEATGRTDFINNPTWQRAVRLAIDTLRSQQRGSDEEHQALLAAIQANTTAYPPGLISRSDEWITRYGSVGGGVYRFQRSARSSTETRADNGFGEPGKRTGLVKSAFRPSDDATVLPFLIPSNALLAVSLEGIATLLSGASVRNMADAASNAKAFAAEIRSAIDEWAVQPRKAVPGVFDAGNVFAYEVDGYGSSYFMDDANIPSLLSLPYLGYVNASDPTYQRTRSLCLSAATNKWYFNGTAGYGIGGPHVGYSYAWPMSRIMQILTSNDTQEAIDALRFLRSTTAGTGLIHESLNVGDASDFTRPWFAWVNGLFGEAIRKLDKENSTALTMTY